MKRLLAACISAILALAPAAVFAQSSAQPVLPGLLKTSGCTAGVSVCWFPYSVTNPLFVSPAAGVVGNKTVSVTVTPAVTATNTYGTNYVVGGLLTFTNAFSATGTGIVQSVTVTSKVAQTNAYTLYLFNSNPTATTWTDAAAANINTADVAKVRGPIPLTSYSQLGTDTVASAYGLGLAVTPGATLYGVLVTSAALSAQFGSTSDVTVTVTVLQDP